MITVPPSLRAALGLALFSAALHGAAPARPNLLFILTEDQGAHLSFLGTPGLKTPHMDALARSGMYFEQAFVAYPVCSASKAAIWRRARSISACDGANAALATAT